MSEQEPEPELMAEEREQVYWWEEFKQLNEEFDNPSNFLVRTRIGLDGEEKEYLVRQPNMPCFIGGMVDDQLMESIQEIVVPGECVVNE
jgi:hypothetical protein